MKKKKLVSTCIMTTLIFTLTACNQSRNKVTVPEPGKTITIIKEEKKEETDEEISVQKVERFGKVEITDWLNEDTVIVSKENESLEKMSLAELSDRYPESLYLLDINSKEYELVKEEKDVLLEGAVFSQDKKYLLYAEYVLGDPAFFVMNLDKKDSDGFVEEQIEDARSAHWADNDTIIGSSYLGGAYMADRTGNINLVNDLSNESLYLVEKLSNVIYYNTQENLSLMKLNLDTKEKTNLNIEQVYGMLPSPDNKQMLILQSNGSKDSMLVYDLESGEQVVIAEGYLVNGVSWSPDQRMVAYSMKEDDNNSTIRSLYVYDMLTGKSTKLAVNTEIISSNWSPSGKKLSYLEWDGKQYSSSIIYLQ